MLTLVVALISCAVFAQPESDGRFTLTGKCIGKKEGRFLLHYIGKDGEYRHDTTTMHNGVFSFTGSINEPTLAYLQNYPICTSNDFERDANVFLEPTAMKAVVQSNDCKHVAVTGSRTNDEMVALDAQKAPILAQMKLLQKEYAAVSEQLQKDNNNADLKAKAALLYSKSAPYKEELRKINYDFILAHPNSFVSPYAMDFYVSQLSLDSVQMFYSSFSPAIQNSRYGREIGEEIARLEKGAAGSLANDFNATELNGNHIELASYKEKNYVLLYFWASWCEKSRQGLQQIKDIYAAYHKEGLEVIGVADDDQNPQAWKDAIKADGMGDIHQVLRGVDPTKIAAGVRNSNCIMDRFGVRSLPVRILIDKSGRIIGRYTNSADDQTALSKKLASLQQPASSLGNYASLK